MEEECYPIIAFDGDRYSHSDLYRENVWLSPSCFPDCSAYSRRKGIFKDLNTEQYRDFRIKQIYRLLEGKEEIGWYFFKTKSLVIDNSKLLHYLYLGFEVSEPLKSILDDFSFNIPEYKKLELHSLFSFSDRKIRESSSFLEASQKLLVEYKKQNASEM